MHCQFAADTGKVEQRAWLADGFFAGTVHALCESIFALLAKYGEQKDMPAAFSEPGCYVTEPVWRPQSTIGAKGGKAAVVASMAAPRKTGVAHVKPTERELEKNFEERQERLEPASLS